MLVGPQCKFMKDIGFKTVTILIAFFLPLFFVGCQNGGSEATSLMAWLFGESSDNIRQHWEHEYLEPWGFAEGVGDIDQAVLIRPPAPNDKLFSQLLVFLQSNRVVYIDAAMTNCNVSCYQRISRFMSKQGCRISSNGNLKYGFVLDEYSVSKKRGRFLMIIAFFKTFPVGLCAIREK